MKEETEKNIRQIIAEVRKDKYRDARYGQPSSDEDVKTFICLFMDNSTTTFRGEVTSYGLKHIAERVIGHLLYNDECYHYVSMEQFKRCMKEMGFICRQADMENINVFYAFKWKSGTTKILEYYNEHR